MIDVLLADDHTLVRQGIRTLLGLTPDVRVVAEARDGDEALRLVGTHPVQVALLDVRMPHRTGLDVLRALGAVPPAPPVILLTTFDEDAVVMEALRLGARGFLLKDVSLDQLADAVRLVAQGGSLIHPAVTERVRRGLNQGARDFPAAELPDPLTAREVEVLRLVAAGYSNREIAQALGTAEGTVKNQASSVLSKLGVRDRTRAVLKALELGWI